MTEPVEPLIKKEIILYDLEPNFLSGLLAGGFFAGGPIDPDKVLDAPPEIRFSSVALAVIRATVDTLRTVAGWGPTDPEQLLEVAEQVATGRLGDWACCPVCEEILCDGDCPLAPVRGVAS